MKFIHGDYEIVKREILHQSVFRLVRYTIRHRLYRGGWSDTFNREVLERRSATAILPYDPIRDRVILIEQFRPGSLSHPESPWLIEIPAGMLGLNETPEEVAYRESIEEADCHILQLHPIFEYYASPGATNEYINLYCGKVDSSHIGGVHGLKEEQEDICVINIPADEAFEKLDAGQIKTSPALIALLWLRIHRKELQTGSFFTEQDKKD